MALRRALPVMLAAAALLAGAAPASAAVELRGVMLHSLWYSASDADMERELDLAAAANANVVRVDVSWSSLETLGKERWSRSYVDRLDRFVAGAADRGMKVIANLGTTPCWASSAPETQKLGCVGAWWDRGVTEHPPTDAAEFARVSRWVVARYGSRLAALELWNEPNNELFLVGPDTAAAYARLVRAAYPAAKAANAAVPVLAGSMSFADAEFLQRLYDHGIKGFNDGIAVHPYNEWRAPADMWQQRWHKYTLVPGSRNVRDVQVRNGDDKGLWLTEYGWTNCVIGQSGSSWCVTDADQARFIEDSFPVLDQEPYIRAAVVYGLRDKGYDRKYTEHNFGLVTQDWKHKPAYAALQRALRRAPGTVAVPGQPAPAGPTAPRVAVGGIGEAWSMSGGRSLRATLHRMGRTVWVTGQGKPSRRGKVKVKGRRKALVVRTDRRGRFARKLGSYKRLAGRQVEVRIGGAVARARVTRSTSRGR